MVQTNTVQGPGAEAGVMRIKDSGNGGPNRGLAMALDGNSRWCYLDPKQGAKLAVAEAARKVACTGATPVAATNCLNFGNPEKPEIMAQLSEAIDGIAEAATALGTPITGGNVSLYNETRGEGIYPTPIIGIVGIIDDITKAVPAGFQQAGDTVFLLGPKSAGRAAERGIQSIGSSEYAKTILGGLWGEPPFLSLEEEAALHRCLAELADKRLLQSANDISDGGFALALAESAFANNIGVQIELQDSSSYPIPLIIFREPATHVILSATKATRQTLESTVAKYSELFLLPIGNTVKDNFEIRRNGSEIIWSTIADLKQPWSQSLEQTLHDNTANEVLA
jgi:phosphoribosylformylglycinamidine synthase